jgi:hypothetical protein
VIQMSDVYKRKKPPLASRPVGGFSQLWHADRIYLGGRQLKKTVRLDVMLCSALGINFLWSALSSTKSYPPRLEGPESLHPTACRGAVPSYPGTI